MEFVSYIFVYNPSRLSSVGNKGSDAYEIRFLKAQRQIKFSRLGGGISLVRARGVSSRKFGGRDQRPPPMEWTAVFCECASDLSESSKLPLYPHRELIASRTLRCVGICQRAWVLGHRHEDKETYLTAAHDRFRTACGACALGQRCLGVGILTSGHRHILQALCLLERILIYANF